MTIEISSTGALPTAPLTTEEVTLNMGPQHPSTHGALRLILRLDGERVVAAQPDFGYVHRGMEKMGEGLSYPQYVFLTDRIDYLAAFFNEWSYCLAAEQLGGVEVPRRAEYLRVIVSELMRITSHLIWLGAMGMDLGAFTPLTYTFREREMVLDLFESLCGQRMVDQTVFNNRPAARASGNNRNRLSPWVGGSRHLCRRCRSTVMGRC
ncbi:MAG: hypothetical protein HGA76_01655, partial [Candidatus Firestonebacteria bacterium]|nr:hypothetical protein [Candidatus Firestonebacteria bacterium]